MADDIQSLIDHFHSEAAHERSPDAQPDIGIVMGSDSDLEVMMTGGRRRGAYDALVDELGFAEVTDYDNPPEAAFTFETYVTSAHRTPELMYAYGETASDRGIDVIIAGAGGKSADLPNMMASIAYPIPVIGVPIQEKSVDSVIGMPLGAPIVAVDAGKSFNAALFAAQILAVDRPELEDRLAHFHREQAEAVARVSHQLHDLGTEKFRDR